MSVFHIQNGCNTWHSHHQYTKVLAVACSTLLPVIGVLSTFFFFFNNNCIYFSRFVEVSCNGCSLYFQNDLWHWASYVIIGHLYLFFGIISIQLFAYFLIGCFFIQYKNSLYILNKSFLVICFAIIVYQSVAGFVFS